MRTWPAIDVDMGRLDPAPTVDEPGAAIRRPDLFQAALTDYDVAAIDDTTDDRWRVFFHSSDERDRALVALGRDFPDLALDPVDIPDEDWAARSQANLKAIQVGTIVVAPPWDVPQVASPDTPAAKIDTGIGRATTIVIQPSMGFGTGHHATTRLCLAALQRLELHDKTVLDVGTGSGVLAIAARMLGASEVLGIDDDPDAIQSARENVALNPGVHVELQVLDLKTVAMTPFDIVVANLTGGLLMHTADLLQALTSAAGRLVLSGFMHTEEIGVLAAFRGFAVVDREQEDEWMCVILQRQGAFA